ncbi:HTH-type transcriptional regulator RafR [Aquimixticola soesokkakensis]|uniref:HTH-type transcriptional regulator RafR n=1 Tax=Aquimixticola soesokkakensis TaxID=1519096 RepID=A0A1Y5THM9_9RHOB|nr:LacI family DNA-binding transcriptional regulator [Aquimixticola soesokkakensis]SLN64153.1 HTH-type transcriptional regulator RafR [Aquimixticola soesokkakensis]
MNIKDLAQHLGLSIGTVSRALNAKPDVNPKTRQRVLDAAVELGYSANTSGRSLRRGSTQTVAFVLETGQADVRGGDNFFMRIIDAMQDALSAQGYDLIILPSNSASDPTEFIKRTIARGIADAIIVTATRAQDSRIELLLKSHMPFLAFGRSQIAGDYAWIDLDFEGFLRQSMQQLVALGHRRIAVTAPPSTSNIGVLLHETYAATCAQLGLDHDPSLVIPAEHSEFGGSAVTQSILAMDDPVTALILNYEMMAFGAYSALRDAGLSPGKDLSIVTLRRSKQLRFLEPAVTACAIDLEGLGTQIARETLRVIRGESPNAALVWPAKLVVSDSIQAPPARA